MISRRLIAAALAVAGLAPTIAPSAARAHALSGIARALSGIARDVPTFVALVAGEQVHSSRVDLERLTRYEQHGARFVR